MARRETEPREIVVAGLSAAVAGEGPPLVLLHGIGSSREAFDEQIRYFAPLGYRCVAPDAPGYGRSPDPVGIASMDDYAARCEDLIDDLGGGPCAVVGVSFGGVIAARVAIRGFAPLAALVLADSSRGSGVDPRSAASMRSRATALAEMGVEAMARQRVPQLLGPNASPELSASVSATMISAVRPAGFAVAAEAMATTDHTASLARIACPTLVVVGQQDMVCPPEESRAIATSVGARCVEIADAGHLANQEQPERFNLAMESFLVQHLPPAHGQRRTP